MSAYEQLSHRKSGDVLHPQPKQASRGQPPDESATAALKFEKSLKLLPKLSII